LGPELCARLAPVRLLCLDVDGVLTDGKLYFVPPGGWAQRFSVRDGVGIQFLQRHGIEVAILSSGDLPSGRARAASLAIRHAWFGVADKLARFSELAAALGVAPEEAAFAGDELSDLPLLRRVGFSATVPDAVDEVRAAVHYVTRRPGGDGAVRELCDLLRDHARPARRP